MNFQNWGSGEWAIFLGAVASTLTALGIVLEKLFSFIIRLMEIRQQAKPPSKSLPPESPPKAPPWIAA